MSTASPKDISHHALPAILLACGAYFVFSLVDTSAKYLGQFYNTSLILFIANMFGFVILAGFIMFHKGPNGFVPKSKWWLHGIRSLLMVGNSYFIVTGLKHIQLAEMYGLIFASPFIMTILSIFILKEHVGWHRWMAIIIGFIGVLIISRPGYSEFNYGILMGVGSALMLGCNAIVLRLIGKDEYTPLFPFYAMLLIMICNAPLAITHFEVPSIPHWWLFALYGSGIAIAVGIMSRSYVIAPSTAVVAPFVYSSMIWGILLGYLIFGDIPDGPTLAGAALIITAGLYVLYRERQTHKELAAQATPDTLP